MPLQRLCRPAAAGHRPLPCYPAAGSSHGSAVARRALLAATACHHTRRCVAARRACARTWFELPSAASPRSWTCQATWATLPPTRRTAGRISMCATSPAGQKPCSLRRWAGCAACKAAQQACCAAPARAGKRPASHAARAARAAALLRLLHHCPQLLLPSPAARSWSWCASTWGATAGTCGRRSRTTRGCRLCGTASPTCTSACWWDTGGTGWLAEPLCNCI